jgi:hypothetical protein
MIVLHRASPDSAGPIDSLRAGANGSFSFTLPSAPDPVESVVYIASTTHQGIMYFGLPLGQPELLDSLYTIEVHDTTVVPAGGASLPVSSRWLFVEAGEEAWVISDVIMLENTSNRTLVGPTKESVVWRYPLPEGATDLEVGEGDAAATAVKLVEGYLEISAPMPPGQRQYLVRYSLPSKRIEVDFPGSVAELELFVREPGPPINVDGLKPGQPLEMQDGATYRRFSATNVANYHVSAEIGEPEGTFHYEWLALVMATVLAAGALWTLRPGAGPETARVPVAATYGAASMSPIEQKERLLLELARVHDRLDEEGVGEREKVDLGRRREELARALERLA